MLFVLFCRRRRTDTASAVRPSSGLAQPPAQNPVGLRSTNNNWYLGAIEAISAPEIMTGERAANLITATQ
jgi:hypothetical protein